MSLLSWTSNKIYRFALLCMVCAASWHAVAYEMESERSEHDAPEHQPRALVLLAASYGRPGIEAFNAGVIKGWTAAGYSVSQLSVHYLDLNQDPHPRYRQELARWIQSKEQGRVFDYIVLAQQDAVTFFLEELNHLSPEAIVISAFAQLTPEQLKKYQRKGLSTTQALDHKSTLANALKLFPKTKEVWVVSGATASDTKPLESIREDEKQWPNVTFHYTDNLSYTQVIKTLTQLGDNTIVLRTSYGSDRFGQPDHLTPIEIGKVLSSSATAPTFVLYDTAMGTVPVAGGNVVRPLVVGEKLIEFALANGDVKKGEHRPIPLYSVPVYDVTELARWGAKLSAIPQDAERLNDIISFWDTHGQTLLITSMIVLALGSVVFALLLERRSRIRTTNELEVSKTQLLNNLEYSPHVAVQWFDRTGKIRYWNPASERLYGWTSKEVVGRSIEEIFIGSDCIGGYFEKLEDITEQGEALTPYEVSVRCKNGEERMVLTTSFAIPMGHGEMGFASMDLDVTQQHKTQTHLSLLASVFEHASEGILICSTDRIIEEVNDAFCQLSGFTRDELIGKTPDILQYEISQSKHDKPLSRALQQEGHWSGEMVHRRKDGHLFTSLVTVNTVRDSKGARHRYIALLSDITSLKQHQVRLERMAHYDSVTDLPNRVLLAERLQHAIVQLNRHRDETLAVLYIDLDGFKAVNDRYGHQVGDALLIELAKRMKSTLRETDTLARLGGDEFAAVLTNLVEQQDCERALTKLLSVISSPVTLNGLELRVSASIGVVCRHYQEEVCDPDHLLRQADHAMYKAKATGKNRYCFFDDAEHRLAQSRQEDLDRIALALKQEEFELFYQPKVNISTGRMVGMEALIRWRHPERGLVFPNDFLPLLTHHPLSVDIGYWVIRTALKQVETFKQNGWNLPISVNVDGFQMSQPDFVQRVGEILADFPQYNANTLEFEVLESMALDDIDEISRIIKSCQEMGISFALDDFGTGYSSLNYLKRLPVQTLKIDQSFIRNMLDNPEDLNIIQAILGLAHAFNRQVIAEGVETEEHSQILHTLGCDIIQGYVISKPMSVPDCEQFLKRWESEFKLALA